MFTFCYQLTSLDVNNFVTSNATSMNRMFNNCTKLTSLSIGHAGRRRGPARAVDRDPTPNLATHSVRPLRHPLSDPDHRLRRRTGRLPIGTQPANAGMAAPRGLRTFGTCETPPAGTHDLAHQKSLRSPWLSYNRANAGTLNGTVSGIGRHTAKNSVNAVCQQPSRTTVGLSKQTLILAYTTM